MALFQVTHAPLQMDKAVLGEGKQASQIKQETVWCAGKPGGLWMGKCGQDVNFLRKVCLSVTVTVKKKKKKKT